MTSKSFWEITVLNFFVNLICCYPLLVGYLLVLLFDPEDGDSVLLRKVGEGLPDYPW
jgi:hypothetical protein